MSRMFSRLVVVGLLVLLLGLVWTGDRIDQPATVAAAQFDGGTGYPLPLVAHWNLGEGKGGFSPNYQLGLINDGHYILPWFLMPDWWAEPADTRWLNYYEAAIKRAAELRLPIALVSTQWEIWLSVEDQYLNLPSATNPNVVTDKGQVLRMVSPVGGVDAWRQLGCRWTNSKMIAQLQEWYPNPPAVYFISNNEHTKLEWSKVETDSRYVARYGTGRSDEFKRKLVGDGWITRYRAIQEGLRAGLASDAWRDKAIFMGYEAFGPAHYGRWPGWLEYSLYSKGRIDPSYLAWDGGSAPFYVFNWSAITDHTVFSPQLEAMNWVFMQAEARRNNPNFFFEMSVWNGNEPGAANDKLASYASQGQQYTPARYGGMAQFGMWLLRPRVVREFRAYLATVQDFEPYFLELVNAVDRVHTQQTLREFWQKGKLVANRAEAHPYQSSLPEEYQSVERWFLLNTSVDPPRPWALSTDLPVYALALTMGKAPQRQWLVYAHAPRQAQPQVWVTIPEYKPIKMDVAVGGSFYLVDEKWQRVTPVR
jgi:hypothetical protein